MLFIMRSSNTSPRFDSPPTSQDNQDNLADGQAFNASTTGHYKVPAQH